MIAATPLMTVRDEVLEPVEALQVVIDEDRQQRDQDDSLGGPEVAAVDAGQVDAEDEHPATTGVDDARPGPALEDPGRQPRLDRHEPAGDQDQDRHDPGERAGRQDEQEARPGQAAEPRGDHERSRPGPLARELAPVSDRPR